MNKIILIPAALILSLHAASVIRQNGSKRVVLSDCQVQGAGNAKCGTLAVYENRATKTGRMINLKIVVLPATGDKREPDPFIYFAGGPGSSSTEEAPGIAQAFAKIRQHRDLLLHFPRLIEFETRHRQIVPDTESGEFPLDRGESRPLLFKLRQSARQTQRRRDWPSSPGSIRRRAGRRQR